MLTSRNLCAVFAFNVAPALSDGIRAPLNVTGAYRTTEKSESELSHSTAGEPPDTFAVVRVLD